jgi:hypothetical protein
MRLTRRRRLNNHADILAYRRRASAARLKARQHGSSKGKQIEHVVLSLVSIADLRPGWHPTSPPQLSTVANPTTQRQNVNAQGFAARLG